jgi:predicted Zn-dependent peptidase
MKQYKLKNGLTILYHKKPTSSVAIEIAVKTGSNNETSKISGISHFIEHVVFEGTKNYDSSKELANEIEKYGGELNAYTSDERTCYYVKIIKKHFDTALKILDQIVFNPTFNEENIEKERKVILDEIKMVTDEPRFHQWILFEKTLFEKHPVRNPTYGTKEAIKTIKREDILKYYNTHYIPNNIIISAVGEIPNFEKTIKKIFSKYTPKPIHKNKKVNEPIQTKPKKAKEKKEVSNSYAVFGYKTTNRLENDSYALDVIKAILGRGQSGKIFYEIRTKRGLAYDIGVYHEPASDYGFFAVHCGTDKKNINKIVKIVQEEFRKLQKTTQEELEEAKDYIEGAHSLRMEDTYALADNTSYWQQIGNAKMADEYIKKIRKITTTDLKRAAKKYFTKNYTLTAIEQKK